MCLALRGHRLDLQLWWEGVKPFYLPAPALLWPDLGLLTSVRLVLSEPPVAVTKRRPFHGPVSPMLEQWGRTPSVFVQLHQLSCLRRATSALCGLEYNCDGSHCYCSQRCERKLGGRCLHKCIGNSGCWRNILTGILSIRIHSFW